MRNSPLYFGSYPASDSDADSGCRPTQDSRGLRSSSALIYTVAQIKTCCHGSATRFLRNGEKYYIYFIDNLLLIPTVKEFSKIG